MADTTCVWNICILMILSVLPTSGLNSYVQLKLKDELVNLVYDSVHQEVFIGGENVIIRASSSLVELSRNVTGPVKDNPQCLQNHCPTGQEYTFIKNRNKVLLVENNGRFLITCGSVYHGICQKRNLTTLKVIASSDQTVASSSPLPSVAFIAPWGTTGEPAMYVGASWRYLSDSTIMALVQKASLSCRTISGSKLFEMEKDSFPGSYLIFESYQFQVKYIYGFSSAGYSFFLSEQETINSFLQSSSKKVFITRVCQKSEDFTSYVELPVECKGLDGKTFSLAQSAYLTKPGGDLAKALGIQRSDDVLFLALRDSATEESALCAFSVKEINRQTTANIRKCASADSDETLGLPRVSSGDKKCRKQTIQITETFCPSETSSFTNSPYRGKLPLTANPIVRYNNAKLSAVGAVSYGNHTVVFLGTEQGQLLKVSVGNGQAIVKPYSVLSISPGSDVRQIAFTSDQQDMFVLSKHKLTKVPVEECGSFSSFEDCVKPGDPFCGWCTLYKRCTRKERCPNAGVHPSRFVTNLSDVVEFKSINPHQVALGPSVNLEIVVSNLPPLGTGGSDTYKCFINGKERSTTLEGQNIIKCSTPPRQELPSKISDKGDLFVDLALYSTETRTFFISTKLGFYSCSAIKRCRDCAEGNYKCDWCIYQGKCTSDGKSDCPQEVIPFKQGKVGLQGCPRLKNNQTRFIPAEVSTGFNLDGEYLPVPQFGYGYKCIITVEGISTSTDATRNSDKKLTCSPIKFNYGASEEKKVVKLSVSWRGSDEVYIPDSVTVLLYKCWVPGTDCSLCHIVDPKFQCGWCSVKKQCMVQEACDDVSSWIPRTQRCLTTPNIHQIWPAAGPVSGGTEIDINGSDLGKSFEDINNTVNVVGYKCFPDKSKYLPSRRIVCNTSASVGPKAGFVTVEVDKITGSSKQLFYYQNPEPRDFFPKKGPQSGGTLVTITGLNMNTGRNIAVWVAGSPCPVNRMKVTNTSVPCVTTGVPSRQRRSNATQDTPVTISFDGFTPVKPSGSFIFTPDPTVISISPQRAFFSGGLNLLVTGTNLDVIETPKIFFKYPLEDNHTVAIEICKPVSSSLIVCPSPNVSSLIGNQSVVSVGFLMDDVQSLLNYSTMAITPDPYFQPFTDTYELKTEYLILEGENLEDIPIKQIYVTVEGMSCNVTSIVETQLVCVVPSESSLPEVSDGLYEVRVAVGNLKFQLGKLKYFKPDKPKEVPLFVWIAVGAGGILLVVVIVILVCVFRRSHMRQKKNFHSLETQMTNLESKVARECREAFAELQTDITDLTSDLTTSGMPFLDFQTYMLHVLFPGFNDHPVLHKKEGALSGNLEKGLRRFSQLVYNKKFLLVFIRTLESQNNFQMKDRCNVASLLIVTFQAKMEYATEILKDLLCELIRKSVAKSHPKLLLRRTEYVAEKMLTNWLAFCMYDFLKSEAGEPLFMLFKALKQQSEKGPVDAVTGEARYSLSEDKLLRQAVEFKSLTVTVRYEHNPPVSVAVLDCDSIGQVKEKILDVIFKNLPYSRRPEKDDLQLEWEQSSGRVQLLRDDDCQSLVEGEWRKINMLSQYKIPDGASLKLSSVQSYFYSSTESELNKRNALRVGFSPGTSYSPLAVMNTDGPDEGGKLWHLVKQMDYPADRTEDARNSKMLSEIYLTRLLKTKGTLQQFVDRLFNTVFMKYRRGSSLPPAVKFLFDLLDSQARELNLTEAEVLHTWKNNSLPLRFWINIIKNPNFIFDIRKSAIVDSCLSVIAQLFMDSCSVTEHALGKDSPSNKLLYAREIPAYRQEVENYYGDIQALAAPSANDLSDFFAELSKQHGHEFNSDRALEELYGYVTKYQDQLQEALEDAELSSLASKLEHDVIAVIADDDHTFV